MGVMPWSPLAGGFLTGKYNREDTRSTGRLSGANPFGDSKFTERNWDILDAAEGGRRGDSTDPSRRSRWPGRWRGPASAQHWSAQANSRNWKATSPPSEIELSDDQMHRLNEASSPPPTFSSSLVTPQIRRMVFGGHDVVGWGE